MRDIEKVFRALGQETRLKIMYLLRDQELCVCELEAILGISQSAVSQHLRVLKEANLVTERRMGQWVLYQQNQEQLVQQLTVYLQSMKPGGDAPSVFRDEFQKLRHLMENPIIDHRGRQCCTPK